MSWRLTFTFNKVLARYVKAIGYEKVYSCCKNNESSDSNNVFRYFINQKPYSVKKKVNKIDIYEILCLLLTIDFLCMVSYHLKMLFKYFPYLAVLSFQEHDRILYGRDLWLDSFTRMDKFLCWREHSMLPWLRVRSNRRKLLTTM